MSQNKTSVGLISILLMCCYITPSISMDPPKSTETQRQDNILKGTLFFKPIYAVSTHSERYKEGQVIASLLFIRTADGKEYSLVDTSDNKSYEQRNSDFLKLCQNFGYDVQNKSFDEIKEIIEGEPVTFMDTGKEVSDSSGRQHPLAEIINIMSPKQIAQNIYDSVFPKGVSGAFSTASSKLEELKRLLKVEIRGKNMKNTIKILNNLTKLMVDHYKTEQNTLTQGGMAGYFAAAKNRAYTSNNLLLSYFVQGILESYAGKNSVENEDFFSTNFKVSKWNEVNQKLGKEFYNENRDIFSPKAPEKAVDSFGGREQYKPWETELGQSRIMDEGDSESGMKDLGQSSLGDLDRSSLDQSDDDLWKSKIDQSSMLGKGGSDSGMEDLGRSSLGDFNRSSLNQSEDDLIDEDYQEFLNKNVPVPYELERQAFKQALILPEKYLKDMEGKGAKLDASIAEIIQSIPSGKYDQKTGWIEANGLAKDSYNRLGQGWKIHITAQPNSAKKIAELILPHINDFNTQFDIQDLSYKIIPSIPVLRTFNYLYPHLSIGDLPQDTQAGKFIVIYPKNTEHARQLVQKFDKILNDAIQEGAINPDIDFMPLIGDAKVGTSGGVYVRYGGFTKNNTYRVNANGDVGQGTFQDDRKYPWPDYMNKNMDIKDSSWAAAPSPFGNIPLEWTPGCKLPSMESPGKKRCVGLPPIHWENRPNSWKDVG